MTLIQTLTILVCLAAGFSYINHRWLRLPITIGVMAVALAFSVLLVLLGRLGLGVEEETRRFVGSINFRETVLQGMLGLLLFAGALHVKLEDLVQFKWMIGALAVAATLVSTFLIGIAGYWVFAAVGLPLPFLYCLLFGALISPTDPIAVMGILRKAGLPKDLEVKVVGESLFNDGVGVVIFLGLLELLPRETIAASDVALLFMREAVGGALLGGVLGYFAFLLVRSIDNYQVEVLITLALVMGTFGLADVLHTSGPLAVVVAGILIGNQGRRLAMSDTTVEHLDSFWELIDELLNAILFLLIGLEVLILTFDLRTLAAGVAAVPLVLAARWVSVQLQLAAVAGERRLRSPTALILTWGGLRGGISVALALSLPNGDERDALITVTYCVVVFSILVQGLTLGHALKAWRD